MSTTSNGPLERPLTPVGPPVSFAQQSPKSESNTATQLKVNGVGPDTVAKMVLAAEKIINVTDVGTGSVTTRVYKEESKSWFTVLKEFFTFWKTPDHQLIDKSPGKDQKIEFKKVDEKSNIPMSNDEIVQQIKHNANYAAVSAVYSEVTKQELSEEVFKEMSKQDVESIFKATKTLISNSSWARTDLEDGEEEHPIVTMLHNIAKDSPNMQVTVADQNDEARFAFGAIEYVYNHGALKGVTGSNTMNAEAGKGSSQSYLMLLNQAKERGAKWIEAVLLGKQWEDTLNDKGEVIMDRDYGPRKEQLFATPTETVGMYKKHLLEDMGNKLVPKRISNVAFQGLLAVAVKDKEVTKLLGLNKDETDKWNRGQHRINVDIVVTALTQFIGDRDSIGCIDNTGEISINNPVYLELVRKTVLDEKSADLIKRKIFVIEQGRGDKLPTAEKTAIKLIPEEIEELVNEIKNLSQQALRGAAFRMTRNLEIKRRIAEEKAIALVEAEIYSLKVNHKKLTEEEKAQFKVPPDTIKGIEREIDSYSQEQLFEIANGNFVKSTVPQIAALAWCQALIEKREDQGKPLYILNPGNPTEITYGGKRKTKIKAAPSLGIAMNYLKKLDEGKTFLSRTKKWFKKTPPTGDKVVADSETI